MSNSLYKQHKSLKQLWTFHRKTSVTKKKKKKIRLQLVRNVKEQTDWHFTKETKFDKNSTNITRHQPLKSKLDLQVNQTCGGTNPWRALREYVCCWPKDESENDQVCLLCSVLLQIPSRQLVEHPGSRQSLVFVRMLRCWWWATATQHSFVGNLMYSEIIDPFLVSCWPWIFDATHNYLSECLLHVKIQGCEWYVFQ